MRIYFKILLASFALASPLPALASVHLRGPDETIAAGMDVLEPFLKEKINGAKRNEDRAETAIHLARAYAFAFAFSPQQIVANRFDQKWSVSEPGPDPSLVKPKHYYYEHYPLNFTAKQLEAQRSVRGKRFWKNAVELFLNLENHPKYQFHARYRLAWLYSLAGDLSEAKVWYRKALGLAGGKFAEDNFSAIEVPLTPASFTVKVTKSVGGGAEEIAFNYLMITLPLQAILDSGESNLAKAVSIHTRENIESKLRDIDAEVIGGKKSAVKSIELLAEVVRRAYTEAEKSTIILVSDGCRAYDKIRWNAEVVRWYLSGGKSISIESSALEKIRNFFNRLVGSFSSCDYSPKSALKEGTLEEGQLRFSFERVGAEVNFLSADIYPSKLDRRFQQDIILKSHNGGPLQETKILTMDRKGRVISQRKEVYSPDRKWSEFGSAPSDFSIEKTINSLPYNEAILNFMSILNKESDAQEIELLRQRAFGLWMEDRERAKMSGGGPLVL